MATSDAGERDERPAVTVVGSVHMDVIAAAPRLPLRGETLAGQRFAMHPGGKGGNQATQVALAGSRSFMVGRVGNDFFGDRLRAALTAKGVDMTHLTVDPTVPTGASSVFTGEDGDYASIIVPGAGLLLDNAAIDAARDAFARSAVVLLQLEIAPDTVAHAAALGRSLGARVMLNASPAPPDLARLPASLWRDIDILIVNAIEATMLSGVVGDTLEPARAAEQLRRRFGVSVAIVTVGGAGAVVADDDGVRHVSGWPVAVVDTIGAGDAFAGTLASEHAHGAPLAAAVSRANAAGALAVTKPGAHDALPTGPAIRAFLAERGSIQDGDR